MQTQEIATDESVEFIEDPETTIARLEKIKSGLSDLAEKHMPLMAYTVLLDAGIKHLVHGQNKMFYFPIPWEIDTGLPSHPSLIADARHYCRSNNLSNTTGTIVDSFAEWRMFQRFEFLCCCGKKSFSLTKLEKLIVPIEIVIHHPINVDREAKTLEIKQLVGIRSTDRDHLENHYNLRRDSRVDDNISIIGTSCVKVCLINFKLLSPKEEYNEKFEMIGSTEEYAKQFDINFFRRIFSEMCQNALTRPA